MAETVGVALAPDTVLTVKVALVCPAVTVTFAGTVAAALLLDSVTTVPPVGAAIFRVTVPVELAPPVTVLGFSVSAVGTGGLTVNVPLTVVPFAEAEIVAVAFEPATVVTVKVALVCPAVTVTFAGTVAAALLLDSVTTVPPVGAAAVKVTVPVELVPPVTVLGLNVTEEGSGVADCPLPLNTFSSATEVQGLPAISLNARKRIYEPVTGANIITRAVEDVPVPSHAYTNPGP